MKLMRLFSTACIAATLMVGNAMATKYTLTIRTSNFKYAGTNARVRISLFGSKGFHSQVATGRSYRKLKYLYKKNKKGKISRRPYKVIKTGKVINRFETGATDVITFECKPLGIINRIAVNHNNWFKGPGWHLKDITVAYRDRKKRKRIVFPCYRWLSKKDDDGKIARDLKPLKALTHYVVKVQTGDRKKSGTDARIRINLEGTNSNDVSAFQLNSGPADPFEKSSVDSFNLYTNDLGNLWSIRISHDNSGKGPGWYLNKVTIYKKTSPQKYWRFRAERWLSKKHGTAAYLKIKREKATLKL